MPTRTTRPGTEDPGEVATAAFANSLPGGWLGYAAVTTPQTGITAETDLTGLTATVTVNASRLLRITVSASIRATGGTGSNLGLAVKEGATYLGFSEAALTTASTHTQQVSATALVVAPSAGAHTYKATLQRLSGDTTLGTLAGANEPVTFVVEDLGTSS